MKYDQFNTGMPSHVHSVMKMMDKTMFSQKFSKQYNNKYCLCANCYSNLIACPHSINPSTIPVTYLIL